jgi:hypothetical protein
MTANKNIILDRKDIDALLKKDRIIVYYGNIVLDVTDF